MKKIILSFMILFSAQVFAGTEKVVKVSGMVCAFCAQGIEKKFKAEPAVESVSVSLNNKTVKLVFRDGQSVSDEKIESILKESGFTVIQGAQ